MKNPISFRQKIRSFIDPVIIASGLIFTLFIDLAFLAGFIAVCHFLTPIPKPIGLILASTIAIGNFLINIRVRFRYGRTVDHEEWFDLLENPRHLIWWSRECFRCLLVFTVTVAIGHLVDLAEGERWGWWILTIALCASTILGVLHWIYSEDKGKST